MPEVQWTSVLWKGLSTHTLDGGGQRTLLQEIASRLVGIQKVNYHNALAAFIVLLGDMVYRIDMAIWQARI